MLAMCYLMMPKTVKLIHCSSLVRYFKLAFFIFVQHVIYRHDISVVFTTCNGQSLAKNETNRNLNSYMSYFIKSSYVKKYLT